MRNHDPIMINHGKQQRGIILFIALITLVTMTLAGIAMMRSVDTGSLVIGNLAFRQQTLMAGDRGIITAFDWLRTRSATQLMDDDDDNGYHSFNDTAAEPDWFSRTTWDDNSTVLVNDAQGNQIRYIIHRMCDSTGEFENTQCAYGNTGTRVDGQSQRWNAPNFQGDPNLLYRITVRINGPRGTESVIQAMVGMPETP